jgi:hypothetical protein
LPSSIVQFQTQNNALREEHFREVSNQAASVIIPATSLKKLEQKKSITRELKAEEIKADVAKAELKKVEYKPTEPEAKIIKPVESKADEIKPKAAEEKVRTTESKVQEKATEPFPYAKELKVLKGMGVDEAQAKTYLLAASGNLILAANFVTGVSLNNTLGCFTFSITTGTKKHRTEY